MPPRLVILLALALAALALLGWLVRRRHYDRFLLPYVFQAGRRRRPRRGEPVHVLLCVADHYEPRHSSPPPEVANARVARWVREYPERFGRFRDSDGQPPRHTFFFPVEEYDAGHLDALAGLCRAGFGEVELHLHHDRDTAENFRDMLLRYKEIFAARHGLLARRRDSGALAYGFVHGNWALCNSRRDGRWCGVNEELAILAETGCYADFTMPSAPHDTQTRRINSIYYAWDRPGRPRSHDTGLDVGAGPPPPGALLMVQGPLVFNWRRRRFGVAPTLENACLQDSQPPTLDRLDAWLRARVQVRSRPDWFFVKLHAHGAETASIDTLLGPSMERFHEGLARRAAEDPSFTYHYVTAREMYNLVRAAEAGYRGDVAGARDFELLFNGGAPAASHAGCGRAGEG